MPMTVRDGSLNGAVAAALSKSRPASGKAGSDAAGPGNGAIGASPRREHSGHVASVGQALTKAGGSGGFMHAAGVMDAARHNRLTSESNRGVGANGTGT